MKFNKPRPSTAMWMGLGVAVGAYEYLAPEGELLSEAVDRGLEGKHRALVLGGIAVTTAHLLNAFDHYGLEKVDPFSNVLSRLRRKACEQTDIQIPGAEG